MNNEKKAPVLTLEQLAPYLPYGVELAFIVRDDVRYIDKITGISDIGDYDDIKIKLGYNDSEHIWMFKPILRPISDLTKVIQHEGRKFIPMHRLKNGGTDLNEFRFLEWKGYSAIDNEEHETCYDPEKMSFHQYFMGDSRACTKQYEKMQLLFKWHFDVFGLIEKGLGIDINSIEGKETKS